MGARAATRMIAFQDSRFRALGFVRWSGRVLGRGAYLGGARARGCGGDDATEHDRCRHRGRQTMSTE